MTSSTRSASATSLSPSSPPFITLLIIGAGFDFDLGEVLEVLVVFAIITTSLGALAVPGQAGWRTPPCLGSLGSVGLQIETR